MTRSRARAATTNAAICDGASPLAAVLDERVAGLRKHVGRALKSWDADEVHDARVATRRLKAAADLLRPLLPEAQRSRFTKALRRIRRTFGPVRDLDVMLVHVEAMRPPRYEREATAWLAERLREKRDKLRREAGGRGRTGKLLDRLGVWSELEPAVRQSGQRAARLLAEAALAQMRSFADRADRLARADDPKDAGNSPADSPEDVHELRIEGKALRYSLELAEPLGLRMPKSVSKGFKKLQDALGGWHDYAVLTDEALRLALDAQLGVRLPGTYGSVLRLAQSSWREAERHLDRFRRQWAASGTTLTGSVLSVFSNESGVETAAVVGPAPPTAPTPPDVEVAPQAAVSVES